MQPGAAHPIRVADTAYHITVRGQGAQTVLSVRHEDGRPATEFGLRDARLVALALTDTSIALDAYPPYPALPRPAKRAESGYEQ